MDEGQIKTENKHATELVLILDSISSLVDRDNPEQDVLGTVVLENALFTSENCIFSQLNNHVKTTFLMQ